MSKSISCCQHRAIFSSEESRLLPALPGTAAPGIFLRVGECRRKPREGRREKALASADPRSGMGSSGCCRNKFPLLVSRAAGRRGCGWRKLCSGLVETPSWKGHLERRNVKFGGWRCDSSRVEGSPQLHRQRASGSKRSLRDFGSFPFFF